MTEKQRDKAIKKAEHLKRKEARAILRQAKAIREREKAEKAAVEQKSEYSTKKSQKSDENNLGTFVVTEQINLTNVKTTAPEEESPAYPMREQQNLTLDEAEALEMEIQRSQKSAEKNPELEQVQAQKPETPRGRKRRTESGRTYSNISTNTLENGKDTSKNKQQTHLQLNEELKDKIVETQKDESCCTIF